MFSFSVKDKNIFPCFHIIRLSYNIWKYRNASALCQSECICLHKTVNRDIFFVRSNENTYPKLQMYKCTVFPITKKENTPLRVGISIYVYK